MSGDVKNAANLRMIYFEVDGQGYAVRATELAGIGTSCPFVTYPGLPRNVRGVVQWSGKIFPVFSLGAIDYRSATYLFSLDDLEGKFSEIAIAISSKIEPFFCETVSTDGRTVKDKNGRQAQVLDLNLILNGEKRLAA